MDMTSYYNTELERTLTSPGCDAALQAEIKAELAARKKDPSREPAQPDTPVAVMEEKPSAPLPDPLLLEVVERLKHLESRLQPPPRAPEQGAHTAPSRARDKDPEDKK